MFPITHMFFNGNHQVNTEIDMLKYFSSSFNRAFENMNFLVNDTKGVN